ncbi:hypothetical protein NQ318_021208, partial [Aromia moschata]
CMLEVCHDEITIEIKKSTFVAIIADETTDVSTIFQLALIYRYMVGGKPVDRFWSFLKPVGHGAERRVDTSTEDKNRELKEVCDIIICQAKERFNFTGHLVASNLLLPEKFSDLLKKFPENYLKQTVESYPFLDINKLRTELSLIYQRIEFRNLSGALSLNTFLNSNNL